MCGAFLTPAILPFELGDLTAADVDTLPRGPSAPISPAKPTALGFAIQGEACVMTRHRRGGEIAGATRIVSLPATEAPSNYCSSLRATVMPPSPPTPPPLQPASPRGENWLPVLANRGWSSERAPVSLDFLTAWLLHISSKNGLGAKLDSPFSPRGARVKAKRTNCYTTAEGSLR